VEGARSAGLFRVGKADGHCGMRHGIAAASYLGRVTRVRGTHAGYFTISLSAFRGSALTTFRAGLAVNKKGTRFVFPLLQAVGRGKEKSRVPFLPPRAKVGHQRNLRVRGAALPPAQAEEYR
jgi:hypothetical protein